MKCPHCRQEIDDSECAAYLGKKGGKIGGLSKSEAKIKTAKINGRRGGGVFKYCKKCGNPGLKIIKKMPRIWYYECSDCGNEQFVEKF